jgi:hypothetical protein
MENVLSKNILATIIYYDILDYPLTSFEIWKYLAAIDSQVAPEKKCTLFEVVKALEEDEIKKHTAQSMGFYFLKGREHLVLERLERNKISARKIKLIKRIAYILRFVPFVRMIAVTGRVAMKNAKSQSDLDFLIAIKKGRIFTGRFFVTLITHLLGRRRYGKKIANRACLNYYITTASLKVDLRDIYSSNEYSFIFPVFGADTFHLFQKENIWITDFKPNFSPDLVLNTIMIADSFWSKQLQKAGEIFLDFDALENILKKMQMKRIMNDPRTYQPGSAVMASDESLVFLPSPHGPKIYEKFRDALDKMRL